MHPACLITWHPWCILGQDVKLMISMNSRPVNSTSPAHHHPSLQTWYHSFWHCPGSLRDSQEQRIQVGVKKKKISQHNSNINNMRICFPLCHITLLTFLLRTWAAKSSTSKSWVWEESTARIEVATSQAALVCWNCTSHWLAATLLQEWRSWFSRWTACATCLCNSSDPMSAVICFSQ